MIRVAGLRWVPPSASRPVLDGIDLDIAEGERVLLAGPSGSGKSSLLRALAGLLGTGGDQPDEVSGTVSVDGRPPQQVPGTVGLLTQDPADSLVAVSAGRDLAFGPENLGLPVGAVADRVRDALAAVRFPYGVGRRTSALSGGERQRLALAGLLALRPRLLLLDEPLAMLDPRAADTVRAAVLAVAADRRTGFVVVDHHLDRWWHDVDRLVVLGAGGIVLADGPPETVLAGERPTLAAAGLWLPDDPRSPAARPVAHPTGAPLLRADDVGVLAPGPLARTGGRSGSPPRGNWTVRGASASVRPGTVTAVTGPSGIGKSSLLAALAGLAVPAAGRVLAAPELAGALGPAPHRWRSRELASRISWTPQDPTAGFVRPTVAGEVAVGPAAVGRPLAPGRAEQLLESAGLGGRSAADPRRLSGGEQRRLAVVAALAARAPVLLLDEPTVGQDRATWSALVQLIAHARDAGVAVGIATHDQRLVAALADTTVELTLPLHSAA